MKILGNEIKAGMIIQHKNDLWSVLKTQHVKPGKGGAFNQSKTKKTKYVASIKILSKVKKFTKVPIVAIGGINAVNYKNLLLNNANFLAISGYIWKNKKYKPLQALERLK